jgi:DNA-binding transcriptional LysR family regulator
MYPDVTVDVVEENSLRLEALLLDGKLDVAVIALPARKLKNEVRFLKKEEVYIVASADHPLLRKAQKREDGQDDWITLKDVAGYPLILSNHDTILGNLSRNLLRSHRCKYKAIYENITAEMAVCMAREELGLAFTYASCTEPDERTRLLRIGSDGVFLDLGIGFPSREYHSRSAEALEAVIMDVYSES